MSIPLDEVNALALDDFVERFADIAEASPWVAREAGKQRPFSSRAGAIAAFIEVLRGATLEAQMAVICAHPDLAGRAALAGNLGAESAKEQAGAGLDRLTPDEFSRFTALNSQYRAAFGMPFIYAVKGADKHRILAAFEDRLTNSPETELATALDQVERIMGWRIEARIAD